MQGRGRSDQYVVPDHVQEQIVNYMPPADVCRLRGVSPAFLRAALRERYTSVRVEFGCFFPHHLQRSKARRLQSLVGLTSRVQ
jgi:hypothetical protein